MSEKVTGKPPLYYFGRGSLLIFFCLFFQGLMCAYAYPLILPLADASKVIRLFVYFCGKILPFAAPVGIAGSIGVLKQKNWGRYVLAVMILLGCLGIALFGIGLMITAFNSPKSMFTPGSSKLEFLIMGPVILIFQLGLLSACIWHLMRKKFQKQEDGI